MSSVRVTTNFKDNNGNDLGDKLVTKDYLLSVYPEIGDKIGIPPELWTWGQGTSGQLGNAVTTNVSTPVTTFAGGTNWKQVSAGTNFTSAIKTDGTLWTWGAGGSGLLGNAVTTNVSTPVTTFAGGTNWKQVSSGTSHTAAIKTDGTLWVWGLGGNGRLGNAVTTNVSTPVTTFAGGTNWKQVSSGTNHTAAIKTDGTLWTWGSGGDGRLGNAVTTNVSTPVTTFAGGTNWKQVTIGYQHTAAIKTDGTLWTWGNANIGALGVLVDVITINGTISSFSTTFTTSDTTGVVVGQQVLSTNNSLNSLGVVASITTNSQVIFSQPYYAGGTYTGEVKLGFIVRSTPVTTFAGGTNWKQVSSGYRHTAAIKTDGTLWTWGSGGSGRLGNAVTTNVSTPVTTFAGGTNWKQVSGGNSHTAAIKSVDF